jgi:ubiquinone biosynthesis protein
VVGLALRFVARSARLTALTIGYLVAAAVRRQTRPQIARAYLQRAGGAFVKLGQILAMRYDLLPARYCDELSKLLDRMPPIPTDTVVAVIESDLGKPLDACYAEFDREALAAASIAQVHGALLPTGEAVVVKVIRPGVARMFQVDFVYMRLGARLLDALGAFRALNLRRLVAELIQITKEELDFRREARNIHEMHEAMLSDRIDHYSPALVPELCGPRVLTMERIDGVPVTRMIAALEAGDTATLAGWAQDGIEPERTAELLMRSILEQSMRHRLFHADPHAANLIAMPGGTLAWIDFGMLGWLDERLWKSQFRMREAVADGRIHAAYQHLLSTLEPLPPVDLTEFEAEVLELFRDWTLSSSTPTATLLEKSSGYFFLRIFDAVRRAGLALPLRLVRLYRAIFVGDIVMLKLDPAIDWVPIMRHFVTQENVRQVQAALHDATSPRTFRSAVEAYAAAPESLVALSEWVRDGLPGVGRTYRQERSRVERVTLLLLTYTRALVVAGIVAVIIAPGLVDSLDLSRWALVALGLLLWMLLGRLIYEFRRGSNSV